MLCALILYRFFEKLFNAILFLLAEFLPEICWEDGRMAEEILLIYLFKYPTNACRYIQNKSLRPSFFIFIVPSTLTFLSGVYPEVTSFVISSWFRLINVYLLCYQQIHRDCNCYYKYGWCGHCTLNQRDMQCSRSLYGYKWVCPLFNI